MYPKGDINVFMKQPWGSGDTYFFSRGFYAKIIPLTHKYYRYDEKMSDYGKKERTWM